MPYPVHHNYHTSRNEMPLSWSLATTGICASIFVYSKLSPLAKLQVIGFVGAVGPQALAVTGVVAAVASVAFASLLLVRYAYRTFQRHREVKSYTKVVLLDGNQYRLEKCLTKSESALSTLRKIEQVLNNKSTYCPTEFESTLSPVPQKVLEDNLIRLATVISDGYREKLNDTKYRDVIKFCGSSITQKFISFFNLAPDQKDVDATVWRIYGIEHKRINEERELEDKERQELAQAEFEKRREVLDRFSNFGLEGDALKEFGKGLETIHDLTAQYVPFQQLKLCNSARLVQRARDFGYQGTDHKEAVTYLENLSVQVRECMPWIYRVLLTKGHNRGEIDLETSLYKMNEMTAQDIWNCCTTRSEPTRRRPFTKNLESMRYFIHQIDKGHIKPTVDEALKSTLNSHLLQLMSYQHHSIPSEIKIEIDLCLALGVSANCAFNGYTPLMLAAYHGLSDVVEILIKRGADVNAKSPDGHTAAHMATRRGHKNILEILSNKGADLTLCTSRNATVLHKAARSGNLESIRFALEHGGDLNSRTHRGKTPLHKAAKAGNLAAVQHLVDAGAAVDVTDGNSKTPLGVAYQSSRRDIVEYLYSREQQALKMKTRKEAKVAFDRATEKVVLEKDYYEGLARDREKDIQRLREEAAASAAKLQDENEKLKEQAAQAASAAKLQEELETLRKDKERLEARLRQTSESKK